MCRLDASSNHTKETKMNELVRCNMCFQQPGRKASQFSITSCGHVFCEQCLRKGNNENCSVCKAPCRTILLSNETDPDIKMLFTDVNVLCKKFLTEFTQVVEFQDSHRQRLLTHYKRKISKLEETIKELTQQLQSLRTSQSYSRQSSSNTYRNMDPANLEYQHYPSVSQVPSMNKVELMDQTSNASRKKNLNIGGLNRLSLVTPSPPGFMANSEDRYSPSVSQVPSINKAELMDQTSNAPRKKNLIIGGSSRLSLITPSPPGFMGSYRTNNTGGSLRSNVGSSQHNILYPLSQSVSPASHGSIWNLSGQRSPQILSQTPLSSQTSTVRQPITIANIMQRRH
ncbi:putative E3 SUMO-protein ligase RNF212 isoform 2-T2 [Anomaloglossus baeobatrachus]|uniref:putative E3 SUMO-protein ligase RNF212 isoform X2 n=1 Tax=Anomaloglossus baeobatrachus TaxID=238106 RepID=UPI003F4FA4B1